MRDRGIGRHAFDEYAALTPIFHALNSGAWRARQQGAPPPRPPRREDPVDEFRRDPLTAPIPVQAFAVAAGNPAPPAPLPPVRSEPPVRRESGRRDAGYRESGRREARRPVRQPETWRFEPPAWPGDAPASVALPPAPRVSSTGAHARVEPGGVDPRGGGRHHYRREVAVAGW